VRRLELLENSKKTDGNFTSHPILAPSTTRGARVTNTNRDSNFTQPKTRVTSNNADFQLLTRLFFRFAQIAHHQSNWFDCPKFLSFQIDRLIQLIKPPLPSDDLSRKLLLLATQFKTDLTKTVQDHLVEQSDKIIFQATDVNGHDLDRACEIATKRLNQRLGKRMHKTEVSDAIAELTTVIMKTGGSTTRPNEEPRDDDWTQIEHHSGRSDVVSKHRPTTTSLSTTNRFEALSTVDDPEPSRPQHLTSPSATPSTRAPESSRCLGLRGRHQRGSAPSNRLPILSPHLPSTSAARPTSPGKAPTNEKPPSVIDSDSTTLPTARDFQSPEVFSTSDAELVDVVDEMLRCPLPEPEIHIHPPTNKSSWEIGRPKIGTSTLFIADSNGLSLAHADLSDGWVLEAFRGAQLQHLLPLLKGATRRLHSVGTIVIAVGLNDRLTDPTDVVTNLLDIRTWANENGKKLCFTNIPVVPSLSDALKDTVRHLNDAASDLFDFFIPVIDESEISLVNNDSSGLHYDAHTAAIIVQRIASFLA
jgi:hypothetical protein